MIVGGFALKIESNERINILKTSNKYTNCIEDHISVLKKDGAVWMARIGRDVDSQPIVNENHYLFLYQRGKLFIAHYTEITKVKPNGGYPDSYKKYIFSGDVIPSEYLHLDTIQEVSSDILDKLKYEGNQRIVSDTICRSPKAYVVTVPIEDIVI